MTHARCHEKQRDRKQKQTRRDETNLQRKENSNKINNKTGETRDFLVKKRRPSEQRKRKQIFVFIETEIRSCNRPLQR